MKKLKLLFLCVAIILSAMVSIASDSENLYWFVAASLSRPAKAMAEKFNSEEHSFKVMVISGGSGELISQITLSGKGDLFTPASDEFLTIVKDKKLAKNYTRLIKQIPVFTLSRKYDDKKISFNDLVNGNYKIAIGNPKTMAVALTYQQIEKKMPKDIAEKIRKQEYGSPLDVNQSLSYLQMNTVDAALIFDTMAKNAKLECVQIPKAYNIDVYAYLVVLTSESSDKNTGEFVSFIFKNKDIFSKYGYSLIEDAPK